eukprot:2588230-Prorocentrum_lima.AAC.1
MSQDLAGTDVVGAGEGLGRPIGRSLFTGNESPRSTGVIGASEGFSWDPRQAEDERAQVPHSPPDIPPRVPLGAAEDFVIGNDDD